MNGAAGWFRITLKAIRTITVRISGGMGRERFTPLCVHMLPPQVGDLLTDIIQLTSCRLWEGWHRKGNSQAGVAVQQGEEDEDGDDDVCPAPVS